MQKLFTATVLTTTLLLSACEYRGVPEVEGPTERAHKKNGSVFGEGLSTGNLLGGSEDNSGGNSGVSVNSFLWRASLDTISFLPLAQANAFGGVITTDWYSPPETPGERFKLNVYILSRELRSDGVRVTVHKQQFRGSNWFTVEVDEAVATQLENSILTRARQMRVNLDQSPE